MYFKELETGMIVMFGTGEDTPYSRFLGWARKNDDIDFDCFGDLKDAMGFEDSFELEGMGGADAWFESHFDDNTQPTTKWKATIHKCDWVTAEDKGWLGDPFITLTKDQKSAMREARDITEEQTKFLQNLSSSGFDAIYYATKGEHKDAKATIERMIKECETFVNSGVLNRSMYNMSHLKSFVQGFNVQVEIIWQQYESAKFYSVRNAELASLKAEKEGKYDQ